MRKLSIEEAKRFKYLIDNFWDPEDSGFPFETTTTELASIHAVVVCGSTPEGNSHFDRLAAKYPNRKVYALIRFPEEESFVFENKVYPTHPEISGMVAVECQSELQAERMSICVDWDGGSFRPDSSDDTFEDLYWFEIE